MATVERDGHKGLSISEAEVLGGYRVRREPEGGLQYELAAQTQLLCDILRELRGPVDEEVPNPLVTFSPEGMAVFSTLEDVTGRVKGT